MHDMSSLTHRLLFADLWLSICQLPWIHGFVNRLFKQPNVTARSRAPPPAQSLPSTGSRCRHHLGLIRTGEGSRYNGIRWRLRLMPPPPGLSVPPAPLAAALRFTPPSGFRLFLGSCIGCCAPRRSRMLPGAVVCMPKEAPRKGCVQTDGRYPAITYTDTTIWPTHMLSTAVSCRFSEVPGAPVAPVSASEHQ